MVMCKAHFEQWLWDQCVSEVKHYHGDNGIFSAEEYHRDCDCDEKGQSQSFSGVGAQHQNARAERAIQTIMYWHGHLWSTHRHILVFRLSEFNENQCKSKNKILFRNNFSLKSNITPKSCKLCLPRMRSYIGGVSSEYSTISGVIRTLLLVEQSTKDNLMSPTLLVWKVLGKNSLAWFCIKQLNNRLLNLILPLLVFSMNCSYAIKNGGQNGILH